MFQHRRRGFTLVEILIVIAILGILAGLLAVGVNAARVAILKQAQKFEIEMIAQAVERYREKYGDYPPDGSSWPIMEAHLRKAFPNILISELNLLNPALSASNGYIRNDNDVPYGSYTPSFPQGYPRVFDPAEALVFFLGGFSSDPQRPLTGPGGPFAASGMGYIYNTQRENGFFEFKTSRLTLADNGVSTDESVFEQKITNSSTALPPDLLPVYIGAGPSIEQGGRPIVYFDSRTYLISTPTGGAYFNFYTPGTVGDPDNINYARPFLSKDKNTTTSNVAQYFANNRTFQIMNAGYDKFYGARPIPSVTSPTDNLVLFIAPTGDPCLPQLDSIDLKWKFYPVASNFAANPFASSKYMLNEFGSTSATNLRPVDDNTSNFIDGPTFAESP